WMSPNKSTDDFTAYAQKPPERTTRKPLVIENRIAAVKIPITEIPGIGSAIAKYTPRGWLSNFKSENVAALLKQLHA
ncbi:hypothetical protein NL526_30435, partial [Klebsiella pneumoniae]|nr:hypothetical protein [Klebsiella pneumoniae]